MFEIFLTDDATDQLKYIQSEKGLQKRYKAVAKTLILLAANPRHPSLQTHQFVSQQGPNGEKIFEAYAQQSTPAAYRVFWYYGPKQKQITIIAITPHP